MQILLLLQIILEIIYGCGGGSLRQPSIIPSTGRGSIVGGEEITRTFLAQSPVQSPPVVVPGFDQAFLADKPAQFNEAAVVKREAAVVNGTLLRV